MVIGLILSLSACSALNYGNLKDSFENINGCAVIFDNQNNKYYFHNEEVARTQASPFSTFKIIATLIGLKNEVIKDKNSKMNYSGIEYPLDAWNDNLSLEQAFKSSCVWYFRQLIDKVGQNEVDRELKKISYGNCDISEWDGSNTNPMSDLNGFWINSSLKISPVEQVNVLMKIFEKQNIYSPDNVKILKDIMLVEDNKTNKIYGKTGSGPNGQAWFVGFKESNNKRIYFAVYLNDSSKQEVVNGQKAKEIALKIMK